MVPPERLAPYARNARTHSQEQVAQIAAYRAGMSALGHAMLGAAFASAFGLWGLAPALAIAGVYVMASAAWRAR